MRIEITGSKAHRVWKCSPSAVLPQVAEDETKHEPARNRGKGIHGYLERVGLIGPVAAQAEVAPEILTLVKAIDLDDLPVGLSTEVAFAWNWRLCTARELGRNMNRCYELAEPPIDPDCEIAITLDLVGVQPMHSSTDRQDEHAGHVGNFTRGYVGDYKSGHSKYPAPDMFAQTLIGACCVRSVYGVDDCVVELIYIHSNGDNHKSRRILDGWDMDAFERSFRASMEAVSYWEAEYAAGRALAASEGSWCDYCPAYMACPAKVALVRAIPAELLKMGVEIVETTNNDTASGIPVVTRALELRQGMISVRNASDVWMMLERISDVIGKAKEQVIGIASFEDVPLPDGRVIGRLVTEKRGLKAEIAAEVIEKRYGRAERDKAVKITMTLDAVHQAVVRHIRQGEKIQTAKGTGVLDAVLRDIDKLGGLEVKVTEAIKPHVPKKKKLTEGT